MRVTGPFTVESLSPHRSLAFATTAEPTTEREAALDPEVARRIRLAQGIGRKAIAGRVHLLFANFKFGRMDDVLSAWGLT